MNFLKLQVVFFGRKLNCLKLGSKNKLDLCGKYHHLHDFNKNYMIRIYLAHTSYNLKFPPAEKKYSVVGCP